MSANGVRVKKYRSPNTVVCMEFALTFREPASRTQDHRLFYICHNLMTSAR
ncbi:hypothetical protein EG68_09813 [Paragonimus skrjabini miyazakii]|uniref:Uncharacterized protein n=1 Tax=Paragonimus skrjabini miyazakii TaxID=59628 RepID=A0A8S9YGJ2_9TREM|nr:hypothetical protein EG68_09813 [Paragonimus skrjabini miyazakii]